MTRPPPRGSESTLARGETISVVPEGTQLRRSPKNPAINRWAILFRPAGLGLGRMRPCANPSGWHGSPMQTAVDAIYEHGHLRLLQPLPLPEKTQVRVAIEMPVGGDIERQAWLEQRLPHTVQPKNPKRLKLRV